MSHMPLYLKPFREEVVLSSIILIIVVSGSFYAISQIISPKTELNSTAEEQELREIAANINPTPTEGVVLGSSNNLTPSMPTPTIDPFESEVTYGKGGLYDYDLYKLQIDHPRLVFNLKEASKRRFMVDLVLTNKSVSGGLSNQILVSIIKDGNIIVPQTTLSTSENTALKPGESKTYVGSMALIEGTDVQEILFQPTGDLPKIIHPLKQE